MSVWKHKQLSAVQRALKMAVEIPFTLPLQCTLEAVGKVYANCKVATGINKC